MGVPEQEEPRWALGRLTEATRRTRRGKKPGDEPDAPETLDLAERVEVAVRNTARGLARLLELAAPTGARVHFVLQPTIAWTGKRLSPEEKALIEENDRERRHMWDLFRSLLDPSVHATYVEWLETACKELGVGFLDANGALAAAPAADAWFFVDQVHLNDEGNRTVAEILKAELDLAWTESSGHHRGHHGDWACCGLAKTVTGATAMMKISTRPPFVTGRASILDSTASLASVS